MLFSMQPLRGYINTPSQQDVCAECALVGTINQIGLVDESIVEQLEKLCPRIPTCQLRLLLAPLRFRMHYNKLYRHNQSCSCCSVGRGNGDHRAPHPRRLQAVVFSSVEDSIRCAPRILRYASLDFPTWLSCFFRFLVGVISSHLLSVLSYLAVCFWCLKRQSRLVSVL